MAENRVPCPNCSDGFVTTGDRHARTRQDVCDHCAGTGMVEARRGETPEASFQPQDAEVGRKPSRTKLAKLDALIQDLLDEIEEADEGDTVIEALFAPLSIASAAVHSVLTKGATHG